MTNQQLTPAEIRLAQYGQRTSTWSTATYNDGTEKALHEIALGLKAEVDRLRDRVAELEAYAHGCDAEGCVLPHSSWCERAKKTAAENNGCTCGQPWTGHPQPHAMHCWTVNPPRAEVEEMRWALAEMRTKTLAAEADEIVAHCPDHGTRDGVWMDCHCAVADDMRRRAAAEETHVVADDSSAPDTDEITRLRADLAAEQAQHATTLRQRNNRSQRLLHLRDLAIAGDTEQLLAAAKDTLAASADDHAPASGASLVCESEISARARTAPATA